MIVDAHTHIFPVSIVERRATLVASDPLFAALYGDPRARLASAADLLAAMAHDGIHRSIVAGFTWQQPALALEHNESLLAAAATSSGRLVALCCIPHSSAASAVKEMERCARSGAAGFGELRLDSYAAVDPALPFVIAETAEALGLPLLLHASEPVGHSYPGKSGGDLATIWTLLSRRTDLTVILAHLGGGLPFYGRMPEVRERLRGVYVDTAAAPWLYDATAVRLVIDELGARQVLFGSDFPLRRPGRDIAWLRAAGLSDGEMEAVLGLNAIRAYRLKEVEENAAIRPR